MTLIFDNDYLPLIPSEGEETPPLEEVIKTGIDAALRHLHTCTPAVVVLVRSNNVVDLQPLLMTRFKVAPAPVPLPIIQNCPVAMTRGSVYGIKPPLAVGDVGLALFTERSIDKWSVSGGLVDPLDSRHHDLSDAVFLPGLYPFSLPVPPPAGSNPLSMDIYNGTAHLSLTPTGQFKLGNGVVDVLKNLADTQTKIIEALNQLTLATTNTVLGPQPLNNAAAFAALVAEVTVLNAALQTLIAQV